MKKSKAFIGMKIDALLAKQLKEQAYINNMTLTDLVEEILQGWIIDQIEDYEYLENSKPVYFDGNMAEVEKVIELWIEQKCGSSNITKMISA